MAPTRQFQFRLVSHHPAPERHTTDLAVDALLDSGVWEPQQLSLATPGFRLYLISLLLCQHFYLVANAREQHLPLLRVEAAFCVTTSGDWLIQAVEADFRLALDPGAPAPALALADEPALAFLRERMAHCPISRNLPDTVQKHTALSLLSLI
jgi:hypothetical protein